ncbi:MAG: M48 family metalloprotease [Bradyrhizobium sp.]|nr:M48 family metalloprotease [Bradyrhizobium sp.]
MRVNGLYGHVRSNDVRSLALFAGFVASFHLLAALALAVPLAMFDPDHSPLYGWAGYLIRWVPIVTVIGAMLFAVQMAWHVRTIRRRTDFRFVDDQDEPRLCRIVEPLTIAAGLPTPYVAVIDSQALNAFACGIRQNDAVLVFTRGLIDGLDDDELAAVAAHEIVHIVNGDIRLIAATNVCLDTLNLLQPRPSPQRMKRIHQACILPFLAWGLPLLAVLILAVMFLRRLAVDGSRLARLLIASAREFIADAEAVRLTQNPAALVSALRRIEGRSVIPGLTAGQDAMMIDGAHEGALATHPTIAERVAAIVSVTGSMTVIAPARRDTRPSGLAAAAGFGRRPASGLEAGFLQRARQGAAAALLPASSGEFNRLGLTPELTVGAVVAIGVFLWTHSADLGKPSVLARAFDPAPLRTSFAMGGEGLRCQLQGIVKLTGLGAKPTGCDPDSYEKTLAAHRGKDNMLGKLPDAMPEVGVNSSGIYTRPNGTFTNVVPPDVKLAEVQRARCFQGRPYSVERNLHAVTEQPRGDISFPRYLAYNDAAARNVSEAATPADRDLRLLDYFNVRKLMGETIHRFFGDPGLQAAAPRSGAPEHQAAIALLRERLTVPGFASKLSPLERAELELLAAAPQDFVSCVARRVQGQKKA